MSLTPRCNFCSSAGALSRRGACKVTLSCNREHQVANRKSHAQECKAVKKTKDVVQREEKKLRDHPGDFIMPANPFETSAGHFWGMFDTRDYMRARYALVEALLSIKTFDAVEAAADHLLGMIRLNRSDNMGLRDIIPNLLLRLGRDQQCYDFIKWWGTVGLTGDYDSGNLALPYLDIVGADVFQSPKYLCGVYPSLSHLVAVALLKMKLLFDIKNISNCAVPVQRIPQELVDKVKTLIPLSRIIWKDSKIMSATQHESLIRNSSAQVETLVQAVFHANKHFWPALIDPGTHLSARPVAYSRGGKRKMQAKLQLCYDSWLETPGAVHMVNEMMEGTNFDEISDGSDEEEVEYGSGEEAAEEW